MPTPYIGEIRMFAGNFAPAGWQLCEGQLLPISEYEALFNLIGTTYGGDGQNTFALPDMRGRIPLHQGNGFALAQTSGVETVTLTVNQIPSHAHGAVADAHAGTSADPRNHIWANSAGAVQYSTDLAVPSAPMAAGAVQNTGGNQPHTNFQPYLCVDFIISLYGIYPSPS
ncbi:MAG: tail fiber protein [Coriobacteriia bacterium]|nr:tail fiber protein [Coriobacteriia bacterium]